MSSAIPSGVMAYESFLRFTLLSIIQPRSTKCLRTAFIRSMDMLAFSVRRCRLARGSSFNVFTMLCKVATSLSN